MGESYALTMPMKYSTTYKSHKATILIKENTQFEFIGQSISNINPIYSIDSASQPTTNIFTLHKADCFKFITGAYMHACDGG